MTHFLAPRPPLAAAPNPRDEAWTLSLLEGRMGQMFAVIF